MKYLITVTLLNSYNYYMSEFGKREDFINLLAKDKFEPNDAILKGFQFEEDIENYTKVGSCQRLRGKWLELKEQLSLCKDNKTGLKKAETIKNKMLEVETEADIIKEFGEKVKGGVWQKGLSKIITMGNHQYVLYGKADVIKRDVIYDVKYTGKYEPGKFQSSMQHRIELLSSPLNIFEYIVSDLKSSWVEPYNKTGKELEEVKTCLNELLAYLERDEEAKKLFEKNWLSKY